MERILANILTLKAAIYYDPTDISSGKLTAQQIKNQKKKQKKKLKTQL
jgi:hypothetical protein